MESNILKNDLIWRRDSSIQECLFDCSLLAALKPAHIFVHYTVQWHVVGLWKTGIISLQQLRNNLLFKQRPNRRKKRRKRSALLQMEEGHIKVAYSNHNSRSQTSKHRQESGRKHSSRNSGGNHHSCYLLQPGTGDFKKLLYLVLKIDWEHSPKKQHHVKWGCNKHPHQK